MRNVEIEIAVDRRTYTYQVTRNGDLYGEHTSMAQAEKAVGRYVAMSRGRLTRESFTIEQIGAEDDLDVEATTDCPPPIAVDASRMTPAAAGYMELDGAPKGGDCDKVEVPGGVSNTLGCCNEFKPQAQATQFRCGTCTHVRNAKVVEDKAPPREIRLAMDRAPSARTKDAVNGWLHIKDCRISKANVCPYLGKEIPKSESLGLEPERIYYLYRDAAALEAAAKSFERAPLMLHHVAVTADQPNKDKIIGAISNVRWSAPYLIADLTVWDGEGIEAIESERQQELSPGYHYVPQMNSGVAPDGERYDGRMLDIFANHLAIVDTGRTGPDVMVNDKAIKA